MRTFCGQVCQQAPLIRSVQDCGLLRVYPGCCRPGVVMMGTDLPLSMYIAPFLPLAMMILLPILGQEE